MLGLNQHAWETFVAYRKKIRKPLKEVSFDAAKKRLASFGDDAAQMEAVLTTVACGWTGVFPPKKQPPAVLRAEDKAKQRAAAEAERMAELALRAAKVKFRAPFPGEDFIGYHTLVTRAESDARDRQIRERLGPQSVSQIIEGRS